MKPEIWKPVKNYEGLYEVSNFGRVRSLARYTTKGKILTPILQPQGYAKVSLFKEGKSRKRFVHRLVAEAFVLNPLNKPMVNHLDENKLNNCAENLEWCTHIENCRYGTAIQRMRKALTNHPNKSKPVEQYTESGELMRYFFSTCEAERQTQIRHKAINDCCQGKRKMAGGFIWKYARQTT